LNYWEHVNKLSGYIKCGEFLEHLGDAYFLKKDGVYLASSNKYVVD